MKQIFKLFLQDFNKKSSKESNLMWFLSLPFKIIFWGYIFLQICLFALLLCLYMTDVESIIRFIFGTKYPHCYFQADSVSMPYLAVTAFSLYFALYLRKKSLILALVVISVYQLIDIVFNIIKSGLF